MDTITQVITFKSFNSFQFRMVKVCFLNDCQNKLKKGTVLKSGRADRKFLRFHPSPKVIV